MSHVTPPKARRSGFASDLKMKMRMALALFGAAMEQSNMWIDALHDLTIELQDEAQNTVCRWMSAQN
jgi:hypothetical protein